MRIEETDCELAELVLAPLAADGSGRPPVFFAPTEDGAGLALPHYWLNTKVSIPDRDVASDEPRAKRRRRHT